MNQHCEIFNSILTALGITGAVPRKKQVPFSVAIVENKITIVIAGAGFGKSTSIN